MAVIAPQQKATQRQEEERRSGQIQSLGGPQMGPQMGAMAAPGQGMAQPQKQAPTSRFGRLQQYIEANEQQAESMGQRLTGGAESRAEKAKEQVGQAGLGFQASKGVLEQEIAAQPGLSQKVFSGAEQYTAPEATPELQQEREQFGRLYGGQTLQEAQTLGPDLAEQAATQADVARMGEALSTGRGRFDLLGERFGRALGPQYTSGQKALDLLLLQGAPGVGKGAAERLTGTAKSLGQQISGLESQIGEARGTLSQQALDAQTQAQQLFQQGLSPEELEAELSGRGLGDIQAAIEAQQSRLLERQPQLVQQMKEALSNQVLTEDQMKQLGLGTGYKSYGLDLSEWLGAGAAPTLAQSADQNELARLRALQELTGTTGGFLEGIDDVGGYSPTEWKDVLGKDFRQAVQERQQAYETGLQEANIPQLQGIADWAKHYIGLGGKNTADAQQFVNAWENVQKNPNNPQAMVNFRDQLDNWLKAYYNTDKSYGGTSTGIPESVLQNLTNLIEEYDPTRSIQKIEQAGQLKPFV